MGIFGSIVEPATTHLAALHAGILHRRPIGAQPVGDDGFGASVALHRALEESQRCLAVPAFCDKDLQHLAFVIDGPLDVKHFTVDLHEDLVQVPTPWRVAPVLDTTLSDLGSEPRAKPVPPEPHRLMANTDPPLEQQVLDLPQ